MKLEQFLQDFGGASLIIEEVAVAATQVEDCDSLASEADYFLCALGSFKQALKDVGFAG